MAYDTLILDKNNVLKPIFEKTCGNMVVRNLDNTIQMILAMGGGADVKLGGAYVEIQFDDKLHAGGGYPDSSNSIAHLYSDSPEHGVTARVTPDFVFGYSTKPVQKQIIYEEGGEVGNYFNEHRYAIAHASRMISHIRNATFMWEGNGKVNEVAINSAPINASSSGTLTVAVRDHLQPNFRLEVRDAGGTPVANVLLRVDKVSPGPQQGPITVTNLGSSNYTPTAGHQLYIAGASTNAAMPGILSACNDTAYPLAGLNNQPVDNDLFKAHVETPATDGYLSHRDLIMFDQNGQTRMPDDDLANFDRRNKVRTFFGEIETCAGIYLMNHAGLNALRDSFFQTGNSGSINRLDRSQLPYQIDQGWGKVHLVDGIRVHATNMMVPNTTLRVYAPGFRGKFTNPRAITPQQMAGMSHISGTLNFELILAQYGTIFVKNRMAQGRLNGRFGFDEAAAGWTEGYE